MANTFDVRGAKDKLIELLQGTPGLTAVVDGAPESMPTTATAWVTIGDLVQPVQGQAYGGRFQLAINLIVEIGFVVNFDEASAEDAVGDAISNITRRIHQNRQGTVNGVTVMLGGTVQKMELPRAAANPSDYLQMAGSEVRRYPIAIEITQYENLGT